MEKLRKVITITIAILFSVMFIGCEEPQEGSKKEREALEKMTVQERQLYDAAYKAWSKKNLFHIREALRNRPAKPFEDSIPFIDMVKVIKNTNDIEMVPDSSWSDNDKKRYLNATFSKIDQQWYCTYIDPSKAPELQSTLKTEPGKITEKSVFEEPKIISPNKQQKTVRYISIEEYEEIKWEIKDCQSAKMLLNKIASTGRPLTGSRRLF